jgi:hypothetical protein
MNQINLGAALGEEEQLPIQYQPMDIEKAKSRFKEYIENIEEMVRQAQGLEVKTDETNQEAVRMGTSAKGLTKKIELARKQVIEQPSDFVKGINAFCKLFTDKLASIEELMKSKISSYRAFQEQQRREAEIAMKKATEDLQKDLDKKAKETGTEPVKLTEPIVPKRESVTRTETGSAHARKVWDFEIIDVKAVPREYLVVSTTLVRDAVRGGVREIPGMRIYERDGTTFRV